MLPFILHCMCSYTVENLQLELDFESYQKDSLLKLTLEYEKLEKFVLHKLREENPDKLYDDFNEKSSSKYYSLYCPLLILYYFLDTVWKLNFLSFLICFR